MKRMKLKELEEIAGDTLPKRSPKTIRLEVTSETITIATPYFLSSPDDPQAKRRADRKRADHLRAVLLDELARIEAGINRARAHAYLLERAEEFESMLQMVARVRSRLSQ